MGKKWCIGVLFSLLLLCFAGALAASAAPSDDAGSLAVALAEETPPTGIGFSPLQQEVAHGETITLAIQINDAVNLYGAQVHARFDPAVLMVVDADSSEDGIQITPGNLPPPMGFHKSEANNQLGTVYYAVSLLGAVPPSNGSGTLATITFKAIGVGASAISISSVMMFRSDLLPIQPIIGENAEITALPPDYPFLAHSTQSASRSEVTANDRLRYTIAAINRGAGGPVTISDYVPKSPLVSLITSTLTSTLGAPTWDPAENDGFGLIQWDGQLAANQTMTITFEMAVGRAQAATPVTNTVILSNYVSPDVILTNVTRINPPSTFLPLLCKQYWPGE